MKKQQFNPEEYAKIKHRVDALKSRVRLDIGSEQDVAKRLLTKVEKKLKQYEATHEISNQFTGDYSTTTNYTFYDENVNNRKQAFRNADVDYRSDSRSEEEMIKDLGVLYAIFGSTYQTILNYHVYKIRFQKLVKRDESAFCQTYADIYEDDIRICDNIIIGFWPYHSGDDRCGDMQLAAMDAHAIKKYNEFYGGLYTTLLDELMDLWNTYFDEGIQLKLTGSEMYYIESNYQDSIHIKPAYQLNLEQRREVIYKSEKEINSGKMKYLECLSVKYTVWASNPYKDLNEFLEQSGVVYKVEPTGIYIWNNNKKRFGKLVGYEYVDRGFNSYCLYLN